MVADWLGGRVVAHDLSDGQRRPARDISTLLSSTILPTVIRSDGDIPWVADGFAGVNYAYAVPAFGQ